MNANNANPGVSDAKSLDARGRDALAVFARAPRVGRVKTRLARTLGDESACRIYEAMLRDVLATARESGAARVVVFGTPEDAFEPGTGSLRAFWDGEHRRQAGDDLGARMLRALNELRDEGARRVVLIGTDAPDLPASFLRRAFDALSEAEMTLGAARDGGFYLIGAARPLPMNALDGVTWSAPDTLARTRAKLKLLGVSAVLLDEWSDVDTPDDLEALRERLRSGASVAAHTAAWLQARETD